MKLKPLSDRVVVEPLEVAETTSSGIVIPDTAKERPQQGKIIAIGSGKLSNNGEKVPMSVKVGDTVLFPKYGGTEVKIEGKKYLIMGENEILAIVD